MDDGKVTLKDTDKRMKSFVSKFPKRRAEIFKYIMDENFLKPMNDLNSQIQES